MSKPSTPKAEYKTPTLHPILSVLDYDSCIEFLRLIADRLDELIAEQEEFTDGDLAIHLATINNLDAILILHGLQREEGEDDAADEEGEEEL